LEGRRRAKDSLLSERYVEDWGADGLCSILAGQMKVEVRSRLNQPLWPKRESSDIPVERQKPVPTWELHRRQIGSAIREDNGRLTVPIPTPWVPEAAYIFVDNTQLRDLRTALMSAVLVEEQPNQE
jgi:hypothetical protein